MKYPGARLLVFSKAPEPGQVKTRLAPLLGAGGAAELHGELLDDCLARVTAPGLCPVQLHCAPDTTHAHFQALRRRYPVTLVDQAAGDLGRRMELALQGALATAENALLIGVDCPLFSAADLEQALAALQAGSDVVLGPAQDGGYYLIGLRRPAPELFRAMPWGTSTVFSQTLQRSGRLGLSTWCLPCYRDIDTPDDYRAWRGECT